MISLKPSRTFIFTTLLMVVSLLAGLLAAQLTQFQIENSFQDKLDNHAKLRADAITSATLNGLTM